MFSPLMDKYDVTVSVWNDFWGPELCDGLQRAGFQVLALRSERTVLKNVTTKSVLSSLAMTRLFQRTQWKPFLESAQNTFERYALRHTGSSPVFWGWNGHHLSAFQSARKKGQRVIVERGSTHGAWAARRLNTVHARLGWGATNIELNPREQRAMEEYKLAEKICVPSQFVKKTFLEEGVSESQLFVNPYGVDLEHWSQVKGEKRTQGKLIFIFTASITPRKGMHILLEAWEKAALPDAELWCCGGIHFPIKELGLPVGQNVKLLGYTTHSKLLELYDQASVYVLPSFEEGLARSGLEAMAAGLPMIVTEETGLTDVMEVGTHGWVVPSGDVERLADTLREAAGKRDQLAAMSKKCRTAGSAYTKRAYGDRAAGFLKTHFPEIASGV